MLETKNDTGSASRQKSVIVIAMLAIMQWLGSGCQSVGPVTPTIASAPARPKPNDFESIMGRLNKTSHAGVRNTSEHVNEPPANISAVQARALAKLNDSANASTTNVNVVPPATVKPAESPLPVILVAGSPPTAMMVRPTALILTNRTAEPEKIASPLPVVMTVKARSTNDDDDEGTGRTYAAGSARPGQDPPADANGAWVRRGILSFSVGCLGAGCFLLRVIRLGRFAGKLVSSGVQVAARLRA